VLTRNPVDAKRAASAGAKKQKSQLDMFLGLLHPTEEHNVYGVPSTHRDCVHSLNSCCCLCVPCRVVCVRVRVSVMQVWLCDEHQDQVCGGSL